MGLGGVLLTVFSLSRGTLSNNKTRPLSTLFLLQAIPVLRTETFVLRELFSFQSASSERGRKWKTLWQVIPHAVILHYLWLMKRKGQTPMSQNLVQDWHLSTDAPSRNYFFPLPHNCPYLTSMHLDWSSQQNFIFLAHGLRHKVKNIFTICDLSINLFKNPTPT